MPRKPKKNPHAVALGKLGGKVGGKAQTKSKGFGTKAVRDKALKARMKKLTPDQSRAIARQAAAARWGKEKAE